MSKQKEQPIEPQAEVGFSQKIKFIQPFEGELTLGGKAYKFRVISKQLWPQGKRGPKTPVEMEITNEAVYNWLRKFEAVSA